MNYELGIKQLGALIETLKAVKRKENCNLNMDYFEVMETPCGYAACICGYHSTSDLEYFPMAQDVSLSTGEIASAVAVELDCSMGGSVGGSIWFSVPLGRHRHAKESGLFSKQELKHLAHLNEDEPTIDDAIEYLGVLKTKIKAICAS